MNIEEEIQQIDDSNPGSDLELIPLMRSIIDPIWLSGLDEVDIDEWLDTEEGLEVRDKIMSMIHDVITLNKLDIVANQYRQLLQLTLENLDLYNSDDPTDNIKAKTLYEVTKQTLASITIDTSVTLDEDVNPVNTDFLNKVGDK